MLCFIDLRVRKMRDEYSRCGNYLLKSEVMGLSFFLSLVFKTQIDCLGLKRMSQTVARLHITWVNMLGGYKQSTMLVAWPTSASLGQPTITDKCLQLPGKEAPRWNRVPHYGRHRVIGTECPSKQRPTRLCPGCPGPSSNVPF